MLDIYVGWTRFGWGMGLFPGTNIVRVSVEPLAPRIIFFRETGASYVTHAQITIIVYDPIHHYHHKGDHLTWSPHVFSLASSIPPSLDEDDDNE